MHACVGGHAHTLKVFNGVGMCLVKCTFFFYLWIVGTSSNLSLSLCFAAERESGEKEWAGAITMCSSHSLFLFMDQKKMHMCDMKHSKCTYSAYSLQNVLFRVSMKEYSKQQIYKLKVCRFTLHFKFVDLLDLTLLCDTVV